MMPARQRGIMVEKYGRKRKPTASYWQQKESSTPINPLYTCSRKPNHEDLILFESMDLTSHMDFRSSAQNKQKPKRSFFMLFVDSNLNIITCPSRILSFGTLIGICPHSNGSKSTILIWGGIALLFSSVEEGKAIGHNYTCRALVAHNIGARRSTSKATCKTGVCLLPQILSWDDSRVEHQNQRTK